jgi:hypothetical protein
MNNTYSQTCTFFRICFFKRHFVSLHCYNCKKKFKMYQESWQTK